MYRLQHTQWGRRSTQGADADGLTGIQKAFPNIPTA